MAVPLVPPQIIITGEPSPLVQTAVCISLSLGAYVI
jgi:hypothetical protein